LPGRRRTSRGAVPGSVAAFATSDTVIRPPSVTNALGRFELTGVPAVAVALTVHAAGYLDAEVDGVHVGTAAPATVTVELAATPNVLERVQVTASKAP